MVSCSDLRLLHRLRWSLSGLLFLFFLSAGGSSAVVMSPPPAGHRWSLHLCLFICFNQRRSQERSGVLQGNIRAHLRAILKPNHRRVSYWTDNILEESGNVDVSEDHQRSFLPAEACCLWGLEVFQTPTFSSIQRTLNHDFLLSCSPFGVTAEVQPAWSVWHKFDAGCQRPDPKNPH